MLVVPIQIIGDAELISSNVVEELPLASAGTTIALWNAATPYVVNNQTCHVGPPPHTSGKNDDGALAVFGIYTALYAGTNLEPGKTFADGGTLPGYWAWRLDKQHPVWAAGGSYAKGMIVGHVNGSAGATYQSLTDNNTGNAPHTSPSHWRQTGTSYATWLGSTSYGLGERTTLFFGTRGLLFESLQAANLNHAPATSPTWWKFLGESYKSHDAAATYAKGEVVIDPQAHREYESLVNGNVGQALTDATKWLDRGMTQRWRMFDQKNSAITARVEEVDVTVQLKGFTDTVLLENISGAEAEITAFDGATQVFSRVIDLSSVAGISDYFDYFFEPIMRPNAALVTDLPMYADMTLRVQLREPGGTASIGTLAPGKSRNLGATLYGAKLGRQDYSKTLIDDFGETTFVKRHSAKTNSLKVKIAKGRSEIVSRVLDDLRGTLAVYVGEVGDDWRETWVHGWYTSMAVDREGPNADYCNLDIRGSI